MESIYSDVSFLTWSTDFFSLLALSVTVTLQTAVMDASDFSETVTFTLPGEMPFSIPSPVTFTMDGSELFMTTVLSVVALNGV